MHRAIDRMTDEDEDVKALNQIIFKRHGRYAGVLTDIGFDYFLWRNWEDLGPGDFDEFTATTYANLYSRRDHMSDRVKGYVNGMVTDNWLRLYTTRQGMKTVYNRLRPRLSKPEMLEGVDDLLVDYEEVFNRTFLALFPRLQALSNAYRSDSPKTD